MACIPRRAGVRRDPLTIAAALGAWLGGSLIVLADGRRGLALGLGVSGAAMAALALPGGQPAGAAALLAGGLVAAALRWRAGPTGWGLMEPGSTPRIILIAVVAVLTLWIALTVSSGDDAALRFAVLAVITLAAARLVQARDDAASLTAAGALALALGVAAQIVDPSPAPVVFGLAGLVAVTSSVFSPKQPVGT